MKNNHAYLHCFFTYRAQAATILATVFIIAELDGVRVITSLDEI